ncbi:MAG: 50S ribosomal protein L1 [Thermales bacterium]|nr:50S ribosomal protein L1 [Thermales bacterium]
MEATKEKTFLPVEEAVELLQSLDHPQFKDGVSVELHFRLNINPLKSDQLVRSSLILPHGTGKTLKIAAFVTSDKEAEAKKAGADIIGGDDLIAKIKKSEKIDFDVAVAEPAMMTKLPVIARLLGVAGVMPNPKNGTVGDDITKMIDLIKQGKVDFKNDKSSNIHLLVGKINKEFDSKKLVENINTAIEAVEKSKPEGVKKKYILTIHLASTMSPSIRLR